MPANDLEFAVDQYRIDEPEMLYRVRNLFDLLRCMRAGISAVRFELGDAYGFNFFAVRTDSLAGVFFAESKCISAPPQPCEENR